MEYEESKQLLLKDLKGLKYSEVTFVKGKKRFTPIELTEEIENETEFGKYWVMMHTKTINELRERNLNQPPKKTYWWKFWE